MEKKTLGDRVKEVRQADKLTQQAFAISLNTSAGYISEIEAGKKIPGSEFLISLKRVYQVDIDWLLTGEGEMKRGKGEQPYIAAELGAIYAVKDAQMNEIIEILKEHPGDKKLVLKLLKGKKDIKEALEGFGVKGLVEEN